MYGVKNGGKSGLQVFIAGPRTPGARLYVVPASGAPRFETGEPSPPDSGLDVPQQ